MACVPAAVEDPAWAARGVDLAQFSDEGGLYRINMLADLGELLERSGQTDEAERVLRELIAAHPDSGAGYVRLAELLEWRGDREAALSLLEECSGRLTGELERDDWSLDERLQSLREKLGRAGPVGRAK